MDPRVSGIRKNQLSPAFGQRLGGRPVLPSAFGTPLSPSIVNETLSSTVKLQPKALPALSQLASNRSKLTDLHTGARQLVERHQAQPPVEAHLLSATHSALTPPQRDATDSGSDTTAFISPFDRRWENVGDHYHSDGSLIRVMCTGPKTEPAARLQRVLEIPVCQPDVSYQVHHHGSGMLEYKLLVEMWETPEDLERVIIRRSELPREDSEAVSAHDDLNDQQLHPTIQKAIQAGDIFGRKKHSPSLLALQHSWPGSEALDMRSARITLAHSSTSSGALHYITYTISEDRSGDSAAIIRQVLSALATNHPGETLKTDPQESMKYWARVRCRHFGTSIKLTSQDISHSLQILRPDKEPDYAEVLFERFADQGQTRFPDSLVCTEALQHLNIPYNKPLGERNGFTIIPLALCGKWIDQLVWLSRRLSKQIQKRDKSILVVSHESMERLFPSYDHCIGSTVIPECVAHKRVLKALGYSFRQHGQNSIIVEAVLSAAQLQAIAEQTHAIEQQALKYALAYP